MSSMRKAGLLGVPFSRDSFCFCLTCAALLLLVVILCILGIVGGQSRQTFKLTTIEGLGARQAIEKFGR
jgi:hypothetical protein